MQGEWRRREGNGKALDTVREVKNYKKQEGDVGPCETRLGLLTPIGVKHLHYQRDRETGSILRCWLEQIVNSLATLSFLRQAPEEGLGPS